MKKIGYEFRRDLFACFQEAKRDHRQHYSKRYQIVNDALATKYNTGPNGLLKVDGAEMSIHQLQKVIYPKVSKWMHTQNENDRNQGAGVWKRLVQEKRKEIGARDPCGLTTCAQGTPQKRTNGAVKNASSWPKSIFTPEKCSADEPCPPMLHTSSAMKKRMGRLLSPDNSLKSYPTPESRSADWSTALANARARSRTAIELSSAHRDAALKAVSERETRLDRLKTKYEEVAAEAVTKLETQLGELKTNYVEVNANKMEVIVAAQKRQDDELRYLEELDAMEALNTGLTAEEVQPFAKNGTCNDEQSARDVFGGVLTLLILPQWMSKRWNKA